VRTPPKRTLDDAILVGRVWGSGEGEEGGEVGRGGGRMLTWIPIALSPSARARRRLSASLLMSSTGMLGSF